MTKVFVNLEESEKNLFCVYRGQNAIPTFNWGAYRCIDWERSGAFQIGECDSIEEVISLLDAFDSHFGTSLWRYGIISRQVSLI